MFALVRAAAVVPVGIGRVRYRALVKRRASSAPAWGVVVGTILRGVVCATVAGWLGGRGVGATALLGGGRARCTIITPGRWCCLTHVSTLSSSLVFLTRSLAAPAATPLIALLVTPLVAVVVGLALPALLAVGGAVAAACIARDSKVLEALIDQVFELDVIWNVSL